MKEPQCKLCGGPHYKSFCFQAPKKPIVTRKPLQASRKPIKSKMSTHPSKPRKPLRRSKMASQSKRERPILIAKLDRVFSRFIRLKDADHEMARCVTCGLVAHWREMQNGHYISRRKMSTRWDEMNCHVQCPHCNETLGGNLDKYAEYLLNTYGPAATFSLQQKSQHREKISNSELQSMINYYQEKLASLL
jgi:hypothetical protein